jgi:hypothetical protein
MTLVLLGIFAADATLAVWWRGVSPQHLRSSRRASAALRACFREEPPARSVARGRSIVRASAGWFL